MSNFELVTKLNGFFSIIRIESLFGSGDVKAPESSAVEISGKKND
jgi:hypothetical protein